MVDFKKKLNTASVEKKINPTEIYDTLDRRSITGPLRPAQNTILAEWFNHRKMDKDLIIKLHTGEGKTLIGLLILQSKIHSGQGPCLFICPNIYLVNQAREDAHKFGIPICEIETDNSLPNDFLNGRKILITHVQKVFNGKSIFGLGNNYTQIGCVVLDDAHACIDSIKESFTLKIKNEHECFGRILNMFQHSLAEQGQGTFLEIREGSFNSFLPIPYWDWIDKSSELLSILSEYKETQLFKFVWPLLKDNIDKCQAFISGHSIEISTIHLPIEKFGVFSKAKSRILMSATTQDDSFYVKGLGLSTESVQNILSDDKKAWSGEKMILIPSLIHDDLTRDRVITLISKPAKRGFGIVSLVSSFNKGKLYLNQGALLPTSHEVSNVLRDLKSGTFGNCIVLANRYDGIDLPDESCRVLVIDGRPSFNSLSEKYEEQSRLNSDYFNIKTAQKIEQGLGRSVRGEKDYSIILIIGADLVKFIKSSQTNKYFSDQTRKQIDIGLQVAELAADEVDAYESKRIRQLIDLMNQSLKRDDGWKEFYVSEMNSIIKSDDIKYNPKIFELERNASQKYYLGDFEGATQTVQKIIDNYIIDPLEKGWFLQLKARYSYKISKISSNIEQQSAFNNNFELMKPREGITYKKLSYISENRIQRVLLSVKDHESYTDLVLYVDEILADLEFGVRHEKFENALQKLGTLLGFLCQRPDKQIKKGPDNLWCISVNEYLVFECKSEVDVDRFEIVKSEVGQMNNHCGWFENEYGKDASVKYFMVIPTKKMAYNANFTHNVEIMRKGKLRNLKTNVRNFIKEFKNYDLKETTSEKVQLFLSTHELDNDSLKKCYSEKYI